MILLDTHAWVWWASKPDLLTKQAAAAIEQAIGRSELYVSAFSAWEVALLVKKGRLELAIPLGEWIAACEALPYLRFVPASHPILVRSVDLPPPFHDDPADRIIVATAIELDAQLITRDGRMLDYPAVRTIWS